MKVLEATGQYVLVRPDKVEEKTKSGLIIPESAQDAAKRNCTKGVIVSAGPLAFKNFDAPWGAQVGDRVLFASKGGMNAEPDPDEPRDPENNVLIAVNDEDIIGVYRETPEHATQIS